MILVHLSVNGKSALLDENNILFAEETAGKDNDDNNVEFTRVYLKQPLPGENETYWIDVQESVKTLLKAL